MIIFNEIDVLEIELGKRIKNCSMELLFVEVE